MTTEHDDTIAALATPVGESGIAVVRMSGGDALSLLTRLFRTTGGAAHTGEWEHRRLYHGVVSNAAGEVLDEVVCAVMRAPESYTGEDVVEISCHGSTLLVTRILEAVFQHGARGAQAGEFTKRAFLNGKLDLIQAEAVADLIHARSALQQQVARDQLAGALSQRINQLADEILELLGIVEANIDFIEEGIETIDYAGALALVGRHKRRLDELLSAASFSRPFREGYRVVIAGPVNAGKSSLFNRLVGENRAIVTEVPGTTRDVLREPIVLDGLLFIVQDTAGLRDVADRVERIGVSRAESTLEEADLVLFVVDASVLLPSDARTRLGGLASGKAIVVSNKMDLPVEVSPDRLKAICPGVPVIAASAETGEGVPEIERALVEHAGRGGLDWVARERVMLNARLVSLLEKARERLDVVEAGLGSRAPLEILAMDVRDVLERYEEATGKRYSEGLLDTIFSRFCIGK
jgi:tRNA modification GTPase